MSKLSALFLLYLCCSLFLFHVPPSVQMPGKPPSLEILSRYQVLQRKYAISRGAIVSALSKNTHQGQSMHSKRGRGNLEEAQGDGRYFVRFGIGTPPKQFYTVLELDTQVDLTWIQCEPCLDCYNQKDSKFDPAKSKSYKSLACESSYCQDLNVSSSSYCNSTSQTCLYEERYIDGSVMKGDFATETLSFPDTIIADIPFGCGHNNTGEFFEEASGIFGLGQGSLSFLSQAKFSAFSYCIAHTNSLKPSLLQFGSSATFGDSLFTTPMLRNAKNPTPYYVGLTGVSVNKQVVAIPQVDPSTGYGGALVGLGTIWSRFPKEVYNQVRDVFVKESGFTAVGKFGILDTCFDHASHSEADFPTVAFHFGPALVTLPAENVMFSDGKYICFGFASHGQYSFSTIGNYQQQGIRVSFDKDRSLIGFLPYNC